MHADPLKEFSESEGTRHLGLIADCGPQGHGPAEGGAIMLTSSVACWGGTTSDYGTSPGPNSK
jgi:hypothetical protein